MVKLLFLEKKRGRLSLGKKKKAKVTADNEDPSDLIDDIDITDPRVPVYMDNYYVVSKTKKYILHDIDMRTLQGRIGMLTDRVLLLTDIYFSKYSQLNHMIV